MRARDAYWKVVPDKGIIEPPEYRPGRWRNAGPVYPVKVTKCAKQS